MSEGPPKETKERNQEKGPHNPVVVESLTRMVGKSVKVMRDGGGIEDRNWTLADIDTASGIATVVHKIRGSTPDMMKYVPLPLLYATQFIGSMVTVIRSKGEVERWMLTHIKDDGTVIVEATGLTKNPSLETFISWQNSYKVRRPSGHYEPGWTLKEIKDGKATLTKTEKKGPGDEKVFVVEGIPLERLHQWQEAKDS